MVRPFFYNLMYFRVFCGFIMLVCIVATAVDLHSSKINHKDATSLDEMSIGNGKNETTPLIAEQKSSPGVDKTCKYLRGSMQ